MKGQFICFPALGGIPTIHATRYDAPDYGPPRVGDIGECYEPIQMADHVLFIADGGSIWLLKDRHTTDLPKLLSEWVSLRRHP